MKKSRKLVKKVRNLRKKSHKKLLTSKTSEKLE